MPPKHGQYLCISNKYITTGEMENSRIPKAHSSIRYENEDYEPPTRRTTRVQPVKQTYSAVILRSEDATNFKKPANIVPKDKIRVQKYTHKYTVAKKEPISFCNVIMSDEVPSDDSTMIYSQSLRLISLQSIIKELVIQGEKLDVKVVPSKYGKILKYLSLEYISHLMFHIQVVNNTEIYSGEYAFVYGAVPAFMDEFASHMLRKFCRKPNNLLFDGEIEIEAFCYWQLVSQDLLHWRGDVSRKPVKRYACSLIPVKNLRNKIASIADFKDTKYISATCLLQIKVNFVEIMMSIKSYKKSSPSKYKESKKVWFCFMDKCNIHHYYCPHTATAISKVMIMIKNKLKYKIKDLKLQSAKYDTEIKFSSNDIANFFHFVPHLLTSSKKSIKTLQQSASNVYTHFCKIFGLHIVHICGICIASDIINISHVKGFASEYNTLMSKNENKINLLLLENKISAVKKIVISEINEHAPISLRTIKFEDFAIKDLMRVINLIILKCVEPLIVLSDDMFRDQKKSIAEMVYTNLDHLFQTERFMSIRNMDLWTRTDDDDELVQIFLSKYNKDVHSDSDESGPDVKVPEPKSIKPSVKVKKAEKQNIEDFVARSTRYIALPEKVSRIQCVMCYKKMTYKIIDIGTTIRVSCCDTCFIKLVCDFEAAEHQIDHEAIIHRINHQYKLPIAFNADGTFLLDCEVNTSVVRNYYNRLLEPKSKKRKSKSQSKESKMKKIKLST